MDFSTVQKVTSAINKKKRNSKAENEAAKQGGVVGFDEEEEDPQFDEFLAGISNKKENDGRMTDAKLHELEK